MKKLIVIGVIICALFSCEKDNDGNNNLNGIYTENSPVVGRSQLKFSAESLVTKSETGSSFQDTFKYLISNGKISLKHTWTNEYPEQKFEFEIIDENTIKIENLYPSIPESPKTYMIFKK
jgi:hypothetical protein